MLSSIFPSIVLGLCFCLNLFSSNHSESFKEKGSVTDSVSIHSDYLIVSGRTINAQYLPADAQKYQWYMLIQDRIGAEFLKKLPAPKASVYSANSLYAGEKNWEFSIDKKEWSEYLIIGKRNGFLTEGSISVVNLSLPINQLNKPISFQFNGKTYTLTVSGKRDYRREKELNELSTNYVISDYQLSLSDGINQQVVITKPVYVYDGTHTVQITDIDGDLKPDVISPITNSPNGYDIGLFLSSEAGNKNFVKLVAHYEPCLC